MRVLAADADFALDGLVAVFVHDVDPLAAGLLVEGAAGDDDGLFGLAELEVEVVGLAGADVVGLLAVELEVGLELAFADFRIDFAITVE